MLLALSAFFDCTIILIAIMAVCSGGNTKPFLDTNAIPVHIDFFS
jgi:hypothetical protein